MNEEAKPVWIVISAWMFPVICSKSLCRDAFPMAKGQRSKLEVCSVLARNNYTFLMTALSFVISCSFCLLNISDFFWHLCMLTHSKSLSTQRHCTIVSPNNINFYLSFFFYIPRPFKPWVIMPVNNFPVFCSS